MTYETQLSNIILRLKQVLELHPEYTYQRIANETGLGVSTVYRMFAEGSETLQDRSFRYDSVKRVAALLLEDDEKTTEEESEEKSLLKAMNRMLEVEYEELEKKFEAQKQKFESKLEAEREQFRKSLNFTEHQIELKDDRITLLLNALQDRAEQYKLLKQQYDSLLEQILNKE